MIAGTVRAVDAATGIAVISTEERGELTVEFGPHTNIEVAEPAVAGMRTGTLEDLKAGYQVELALDDRDGRCHCTSITCLS